MSGRSLPVRRSRSCKPSLARPRLLRTEALESRALLSSHSFLAWSLGMSAFQVGNRAPANQAPAIAKAITINGGKAISGTTATLSVLGRDDAAESKLLYTWSVTTAPAGGTANFNLNGTNAAKNTTATLSKAGTYTFTVKIVDTGGLSVTSSKSAAVSSTLTTIRVTTSSGQVVTAGSALGVSGVSQTLVAQGLDQFGNVLATPPAFTWSTTTIPTGASKPALNVSGATVTATFAKAGSYGMVVQAKAGTGATVSSSVAISVVPVVSGVKNALTAVQNVSGTSLKIALPTFVDQFGNALAVAPSLLWSAPSLPLGIAAPTFATSGSVTTVTFAGSGSYTLLARAANAPSVSFTTSVSVNQTLSSLVVTPGVASVLQGGTQQFTAQALDQFLRPMQNQQLYSWSTTAGTISAAGLLTAPSSGTSCTVTVTSGAVTRTAQVTLLANAGTFQTAAMAQLVQSLDADGSINRQDMMQLLRSVGIDGVVDAAEYADLKTLLFQATTLNIPTYVQVLAADVINGNVANANFQGHTLGNLTVGSSATQLNTLVDKWFLGADHPALCNTSLVYTSVAGSLFAGTPSHLDERQGMLGDCYFISALGTLADSNPAAVQNMFLDNGDGTFTVRFYTGSYGTIYNYSDGSISAGFRDSNITVDYVTVDRLLPTSTSGILAYANYGASASNSANTLWIALAEKAYAQWNETGKAGRDGLNAFASIQGGWMATVDAQVLGHNATDYIMTTTSKQVAINALAAHKAVTIGTLSWTGTKDGLYANHAYAIIGYNAGSDTFTLYNPWGTNQPGPLTWSQLQADCSQLAVCDTTGTVPIASGLAATNAPKVSVPASGANFVRSTPAWAMLTPADLAALATPSHAYAAVLQATRELFETLGSHGAPSHAADRYGDLSTPAVDAMFATDSLALASAV